MEELLKEKIIMEDKWEKFVRIKNNNKEYLKWKKKDE